MSREKRVNRRGRVAAQETPVNPAPAGLEGGSYRPLTADALERIVGAAYAVLERTGVEVGPGECRDLFERAGCRVDTDAGRVHIPARVIDEARATARPEVLLAGRDPRHDLHLGGRRVYLGTGGQAVKIMDLDDRVRETRLRDNYDIGRLVDTLDHIHFYMRPVVCRDLGNDDIDVNQLYACVASTKKHVMSNSYLPSNVSRLRRMGEMLVGGSAEFDARPPISFVASWVVSPLRYAMETVEILDRIIEQGVPVVLSSAPQAGASSPASLAGTLVQIIAEQLSGIVYVNLKKPGHPTILGCVPAQADLRTGAFTGGSAEFALMNAACAQIAQYLNLPIYNSSGIADSKVGDAQAGFEKGLTTATAALAGSNYIHHSAGFLESLLTVAYEQYVIDNDVNGAVMRMTRGIEVTDDTLALDVIHDVCVGGPKHYLGHAQTLALMNTEYLYPELFDRRTRADWEAAGALDIRMVAKERARQVLSEHFPVVIPEEIDREIRRQFDILLPREAMRPGGWIQAA
ncbi:trimethylamine methyltransferase family protein [Ostreiculturibacter nitratireducens]|uniref:trimethylamine methyltransferase family protein n=1 Tax=Ostreiculturibacter nitratireducens TaxID=3075226 RepID=UPI0031B57AE9